MRERITREDKGRSNDPWQGHPSQSRPTVEFHLDGGCSNQAFPKSSSSRSPEPSSTSWSSVGSRTPVCKQPRFQLHQAIFLFWSEVRRKGWCKALWAVSLPLMTKKENGLFSIHLQIKVRFPLLASAFPRAAATVERPTPPFPPTM